MKMQVYVEKITNADGSCSWEVWEDAMEVLLVTIHQPELVRDIMDRCQWVASKCSDRLAKEDA